MWKQEYTNMFELEDNYWWYRGLHELIERFVRARSQKGRPIILDAGCGSGKLMTILSRYGEVSGFDFSDEAIRYSKQRGLEWVSKQDLNQWEPSPDAYDIVTCIDVLCHGAVRDVASVMRKFHRCLRKEGRLILNLPAFEILKRHHDIVVNTVRRCRRKEFGLLLEREGFEVELSSYRLPHLFVIILVRKLIARLESQRPPRSDLKAMPPFMNSFFLYKHRIENMLIYRGLPIPFGSSLFVIASKA